jgi:hypothetical protein
MPRADSGDVRRDCLATLTTVRKWKSFFLLLAILCLATHAVAWAAVRFRWVPPAPVAVFESDPSATQPTLAERQRAENTWNALRVVLPTTEFVGRLSTLLLCLSLLVAVQVALVGRLPVAGIVQGFFWSLVVLALLMPWERLGPTAARIPGAFTDVGTLEMSDVVTGESHRTSAIVAPLRFVGYPILAALILWFANSRFHRSYREAIAQPGANIPMRVV